MNHRTYTVNPDGSVINGIHLAGSKGRRHVDLRKGRTVSLDYRNAPVTTNSTLVRGVVVTLCGRGPRNRKSARRITIMHPKGDARRAALVLLRATLSSMRMTGTVYSIAFGAYTLLEVHEHATVSVGVNGGRCLELSLPSLDAGIKCRQL